MSVSATDISAFTNEELRNELIKKNVNVGPIGPSTRRVYEIKLLKLCNNVVSSSRGNTPQPQLSTHGHNGSRQASPVLQTNGIKSAHNSFVDNNYEFNESDHEVKFL